MVIEYYHQQLKGCHMRERSVRLESSMTNWLNPTPACSFPFYTRGSELVFSDLFLI